MVARKKGSSSFGLWELVEPTDPRWLKIVETGNRAAQIAAMENPIFADDDSAELLAWYDGEIMERRDKPPEAAVKLKRGPTQESVQ